jgi:hypothetical protein
MLIGRWPVMPATAVFFGYRRRSDFGVTRNSGYSFRKTGVRFSRDMR